MPVVALIAATSGALLGAVADRLAARWPAHERAGVRPLDWRTVVVVVGGALAFLALLVRWVDTRDIAVLGVYLVALIVLLATDLDQRLLPDPITLPLIGFCVVVLLLGWDPLLAGKGLGTASGVAAGVGAPLFLLLTDRLLGRRLGLGDVKLAVSVGLMSGVSRLFLGFVIASAAASLLLLVLLLSRRIGLRSTIPFGPILICGGVIAAFLP